MGGKMSHYSTGTVPRIGCHRTSFSVSHGNPRDKENRENAIKHLPDKIGSVEEIAVYIFYPTFDFFYYLLFVQFGVCPLWSRGG
jgi:hypothetical protein